MTQFEQLIQDVANLHDHGAFHIKRGFNIRDVQPATISNHLIEEATELQAEVLDGSTAQLLVEASHVLSVFLHLLHKTGVDIEAVASHARSMLKQHFATNPDQVTAHTPGMTRSGRQSSSLLHNLLRLATNGDLSSAYFSQDYKLYFGRLQRSSTENHTTFAVWADDQRRLIYGQLCLLADDKWIGLAGNGSTKGFETAHDALCYVLEQAEVKRSVRQE